MYSVAVSTNPPLSHALPAAPAGFGEGRWVPPGESVVVAGVNLPGGMLYVGGRLKTLSGSTDPCLISGQHTVARVGNYRSRQMGYWPSYADASPEERRAYLNWLSEGRSNPDCDIGYVFLFFYGLERRVIVDSRDDPAARNDWQAIIAELRRLLAIYGQKSGSFNRYAGELLSWIELDGKSGQLYKQSVPDFQRTYELPPYLRLALGQAAADRAPLPAHLALAWIRLSPECYLRTAASRCPNEFERLFAQRYHEALGPGLVLPKNRTKLKFVYQAASAGLRGANVSLTFGDVPDVTALTAPIKKLMEIANQSTDELGSYSRLVGKDPGAAGTLEGLLLLPATLWPTAAQAKLRELTLHMREGRLSLPLKELLSVLGGANLAFNRDRVRGLARALEGADIGMEPHVLRGAKAPGEADTVVLFAQPLMNSDVGSRTEYQMAALTLQLASAVAQADGEFHDLEVAHLRAEIEGWVHLTLAERRRLHAHLDWLTASPMNLSALKRKLEPLPTAARETLAAFMAALVQADGVVSPDEVKFLEKVYKALGVEPKRVFSDIHAAGSGSAPVSTVQAEKQGFRLNAERIATLQQDTVRVSALLSKIFAEEADSAPAPAVSAPEPELEDEANAPLGLDQDHSALLRLLLSRPEWTRSELEDAAADLDLMLDGAMEQINEAAFEAFDEPLFEGEDPIAVNTKLLEKIEA
ncbi:tellurite resistance TerB family protein [Metallibacterium scheffleri]